MSSQDPNFSEITRKASKTFYTASLLYPADVREDIHILYSFLRVSDDMVDAPKVDVSGYEAFKRETRKALAGEGVTNPIIRSFADLIKRRNMDSKLVWDYFTSQDIDLGQRSYQTYADLSKFVYGVAEVVGLYMAQIMGLHPESYPYARRLGEAMQLVNIARDIDEDTKAGKCYIPRDEQMQCSLTAILSKEHAYANPENFTKLMRMQLDRARTFLDESREGLRYFPNRYLLPIMVSMNLYEHVIRYIYKNPLIVFDKKVRPSLDVIIVTIVTTRLQIVGRKNGI
jgi:phytoene synthase